MDQQRQHVLVIDQDKTFCHRLDEELSFLGYRVQITTSSQQALLEIESTLPKAIFVDDETLRGEGIPFLQDLRKNLADQSLALILLSQERDAHQYKSILAFGANGYMVKSDPWEFLQTQLRDILQRHNTLVELELSKAESHRMLEKANAQATEVRRFSEIVAHDLRNPLANISGACDLLNLMEVPIDAKELTRILSNSVERCLAIIDGIYALSGLTRDAPPMAKFSLFELAHAAKRSLANIFAQENVNLSIDEEGPLYCSDTLLTQVFENLLTNAIKFCDIDDIHLRISSETEGVYTIISIEDNGPGVPVERQENIFEPFARNHGEDFEGLGLGLSTVKKIVDYHEGSIWVENSRKLGGACFKIKIYTERIKVSIYALPKHQQNFFKLALEEVGHRVTFCDELDETTLEDSEVLYMALDHLNQQEQVELISTLGRDHPTLNIIAIDASSKKHIQALLDSGCSEVLMSPFTKETIIDRISTALSENFF